MVAKYDTQRLEAERKVLEQFLESVRRDLEHMASAVPLTAERVHQRIKDRLSGNKQVPLDVKQEMLKKAQDLERNANMRACDNALHQAITCAHDDKIPQRGKALKEAVGFLAKATTLGADRFRCTRSSR